MAFDLKKIKQFPFPENEYYKEETPKKTIVIHHTVSGPSAENIFTSWTNTPERVATALVIGGDGTIVQGYSGKYWAHHLGMKTVNNKQLNQQSIGIELCNWGGLTFDGSKYINAYGKPVPDSSIITYPKGFRGFKYFQQYSDIQLASLKELLIFLCDKYQIDKSYKAGMWDVSKEACAGGGGIYTHVSYRADKSDCHPQPELIELLKTL